MASEDNPNNASCGVPAPAPPTPPPSNYIQQYIPDDVLMKLQSGAFRQLCVHLQDRSDAVQNIDLMTVSGFCRNCLAKWLVVEARHLSDEIDRQQDNRPQNSNNLKLALDALGYDEAAELVYGMSYPDWKKRHLTKATDEKMKLYNDSSYLWAQHDKNLLEKRSDEVLATTTASTTSAKSPGMPSSANDVNNNKNNHHPLMSNVCCQDVEDVAVVAAAPKSSSARLDDAKATPTATPANSKARQAPKFVPPPFPTTEKLASFSLGILTVSDRASLGQYESGDLSGPAVRDSVLSFIGGGSETEEKTTNSKETQLDPTNIYMSIVPDDINAIQDQLRAWSSSSSDDNSAKALDLIFTTGGTGFSARDVTPEATVGVVDYTCEGLVTFCTMECASVQPLAALSRGTAGIKNKTMIVNLPGNPKGVQEIIPVLLPLCLHVVADLKHE